VKYLHLTSYSKRTLFHLLALLFSADWVRRYFFWCRMVDA